MTPVSTLTKTLLSVRLLFSVNKKPLAIAKVKNSKVPFYFNTHDPEKIRAGLVARAVNINNIYFAVH